MKKEVSAIIEARLNSRRLKGKVLKKLENVELLSIIISRISRSKNIKKIVVATTLDKKDDKIISLLKKKNISYYRGSSENVLSRIINCANKYNIKNILRITADNPLTDFNLIDDMIEQFNKVKNLDYITNNNFTFDKKKRNIAVGLDLSILTLKSLKLIQKLIHNNKTYSEYPTLYFYTELGASKFNLKTISHNDKKVLNSKFRLTIDRKEDFIFFKKLLKEYKKKFPNDNYYELPKIKKILNKNKKLTNINSKVLQTIPKMTSF